MLGTNKYGVITKIKYYITFLTKEKNLNQNIMKKKIKS